MKHFGDIIIGSGQGGNPLAIALARSGSRVALIESDHVGGTCINYGCTPTKTMVASARVAHLLRRAEDYGVQAGQVRVDLEKVRERKRSIVRDFRSGSEKRIEEQDGLTLLRGTARFAGPKALEVTLASGATEELEGGRIFIDTGTRPAVPPLKGLQEIDYLDSSSIMELEEVPGHLMIIGGGYVGLEFGQMFRRFGSEVSIVQRGAQLLPREDLDVAEEILKILKEEGIEVLLDSEPVAVRREPDRGSHVDTSGSVVLTVAAGEKQQEIRGTHVLIAAGRLPNTDALCLDAAGVRTDSRGFVQVNERLETSAEGVYALGDVKGGPAFTHISYDDFRILQTNLLEGGRRTVEDRPVPYTVFTDPQLGRVGLSEREARDRGLEYRVAKIPMSWVARALETDETRGLIKALVARDGDQILGCAALGIEGGEIMAIIQTAMMGGLPYTALRDGVFAHPSLSESLNTLFANLQ